MKNVRVVISVCGGVVSEVRSNIDIEYEILDYDDINAGSKPCEMAAEAEAQLEKWLNEE